MWMLRLACSASALLAFTAAPLGAAPLTWTSSSDSAFASARREHRFVILDLEAVWCHWCHVMEHETYGNDGVRAVLNQHFVALKIDQDANPDFAARYGDWGWPATIVFDENGQEIVKRRGFIPPAQMISMLQAIVEDPSPGPSVATATPVIPSKGSALSAAQRADVTATFNDLYNARYGGWGDGQRFIDATALELAMTQSVAGDAQSAMRARRTLDESLALVDPVWGGVYQYSAGPGWNLPHFEKIMSIQADDLRTYARAFAIWHDPRYLEAAHAIERYLTAFLLDSDGAFHVSQDADLDRDVDGHAYYALDDAGRRKLGIPAIDKHRYTRENGWAITAFCQASDYLGNAQDLAVARRSAQWVERHRALDGGGFRHDERDSAGPYLGDNVAMVQAFLALYESTAEKHWLAQAEQTLGFIDTAFRAHDAGFVTARAPTNAAGVLSKAVRIEPENVDLARAANEAFHVTGNPRDRDISEHAAHYVTSATLVESGRFMPGVLLLDGELAAEPLHIAVVGAKDDVVARRLHDAALGHPAAYRRVDWWDRREGPLPNAEVVYPRLSRPAAFVCSGSACSLPSYDPPTLAASVDRLTRSADRRPDAK